jgi:hypothetical protein
VRARAARIAGALALATFLGAGCTGENDLLDSWKRELGRPDGVTSVDKLECRQPLPTSFEHCALTVHVRDDITRDQVVALVDEYVDAAGDVYEAKDLEDRLGSIQLVRDRSRYGFVPLPRGASLRRMPEPAALDFWMEHGNGRDGEDGWFVGDSGGTSGTRATLDLPTTTPASLVTRASDMSGALRAIDSAVVSAPAPKDDPSNVSELSLALDHGKVPLAEWRFALGAAARELDQPFTASVSQGTVHLVAQMPVAGSTEAKVTKRYLALRERMESQVPPSINFSVGYRVLR